MEELFNTAPQQIAQAAQALSQSSFSNDALLLLGGAVLVVLVGFWGRAKLICVAIASYAAIAILSTTPLYDWIFSSALVKLTTVNVVGVVLIVTAMLYFMIQFGLGDVLSEDRGFIASSVILAVTVIGALFAYSLTLVTADVIQQFTPVVRTLFVGTWAHLVWLLAPILVIGATRD
ncbi:hypothetical protein HYV72_02555 [Candidatus Uhrbacteria bacterium]|nr:hypothetical protein [Candidatus Uhrbacteria bacterium]